MTENARNKEKSPQELGKENHGPRKKLISEDHCFLIRGEREL